jgi:hypothetical protein
MAHASAKPALLVLIVSTLMLAHAAVKVLHSLMARVSAKPALVVPIVPTLMLTDAAIKVLCSLMAHASAKPALRTLVAKLTLTIALTHPVRTTAPARMESTSTLVPVIMALPAPTAPFPMPIRATATAQLSLTDHALAMLSTPAPVASTLPRSIVMVLALSESSAIATALQGMLARLATSPMPSPATTLALPNNPVTVTVT